MDVADFTYSDIAKAIVPTSVAEILDPVFVQNNTYAQIKVGDVENTTDIRFVSAFKGNPGDYSEVGYYISLSVPNPHKADSYPLVSSTLYKSVLAAGAPKVAPEGCLWLALGINGIPAANADTPIYIRPYAVKADGTVVFNEINTLPGFTAISMYPMLWEARGVDKRQLIDDLIDHAFRRYER